MELSKQLRHYAKTVEGKEQLVINSFAKALEVIPKIIADNAVLDSIEVMNKLRHRHGTLKDNSATTEGK
jgi:T-complex protein 1 subunit eta